MPYSITITAEAESQLFSLPVREQRLLQAAIQTRLVHQPQTFTRTIKKLRPNPFAQYELRVGDLRVLYNVEQGEVVLLLIGRKVGNTLVVKGQAFHEHQNNPPPAPPGESPGNPQ